MGITINQPAPTGGFDKEQHEGHLMLFIGIEEKEGKTQFGDATWAQCQWVADLDSGTLDLDVAIHGKALAPSVIGAAPVCVGRLVKGKSAKEGQKPPWLLDDATDADLVVAQEWIDTFVTELPSGKLVVDEESVKAAQDTTDEEVVA